jgi:hypothetical protein
VAELAEVVKARRELIERQARCEGCGSPLESCEAARGEDPTAPPWFGCCARGLNLSMPCRHVPDSRALDALLREVESGTVRTVEQVEDQALIASIHEYDPRRMMAALNRMSEEDIRAEYEEATWD